MEDPNLITAVKANSISILQLAQAVALLQQQILTLQLQIVTSFADA